MVIRLGRSGDDAPEALLKAFERNKHNYGNAQLRFAVVQDRGKKILYAGRIDFLPRDVNVAPEIYDYGEVVLTSQIVPIEEGQELIQKIARKEPIRIQNEEFVLDGNFDTPEFIPSKKRWGYVRYDWPHTHSYFGMRRDGNVEVYHNSLVKPRLPAYPNLQVAIQSFFDLHPRQYSVEPRIIIVVPDYRARIFEVHISGDKITAVIDSKEPDLLKKVIGKFYLANGNREFTTEDIAVMDNRISCSCSFQPEIINTYLVMTNGDRLDFREMNIYAEDTKDLVYETQPLVVEELIRRGESQTVDFKENISEKTLAETTVAFANTNLGYIIVGIDDNSKLVGFRGESNRVRDMISNIIGSLCDPRPQIEVESVILEGNIPVILVRVPEGKDKPYTVRDRGIFVRRNATNRQITRHELDEFYRRREQTSTRDVIW